MRGEPRRAGDVVTGIRLFASCLTFLHSTTGAQIVVEASTPQELWKEFAMISGKKLMKIGWYMLSVPLILLFLSIIISMVISGGEGAVNPVVRLVGMALVFFWALSLFPLAIGFVMHLVQKAAKKFLG